MSNFKNRWSIEGILTTKSPMHIGNGSITDRPELKNDKDQLVDIMSTSMDANKKPYIPGTTLKGNLRKWLTHNLPKNNHLINTIFGTDNPDAPDAVAGRAVFFNSQVIAGENYTFRQPPPYWCKNRVTGVDISVRINRKSGAASNKMLFYKEYVPPGVSFKVTIAAQNLTNEEIDSILYALSGFDAAIWSNGEILPVTLGASAGNGWGRLSWELLEVKCMNCDDVKIWLQNETEKTGFDILKEYGQIRNFRMLNAADQKSSNISSPHLNLRMELCFNGPFLVNDPSRTKKAGEESIENKYNHTPVMDTNGNIIIPASSLRGQLRSHAEKILRTLANNSACIPKEYDNHSDQAEQSEQQCDPVFKIKDVNNICLACKLFGTTGWSSPITFNNFRAISGFELNQEFVAIDRFTGGGAPTAKFNAQSVYKPLFVGSLSIDLQKLEVLGESVATALGLLILVLKDAMEGDITFGFGSSKGYGSCTANITSVSMTGTPGEQIVGFLNNFDISVNDINNLDTSEIPTQKIRNLMEELVDKTASIALEKVEL